jgi:hypothetical protein
MIQLTLRADDIGLTPATVEAARIAVLHGACRSVAVQAAGATCLDLVRERIVPLRASHGISIGLHAVICCEWSHPRIGPVGRDCDPVLLDADGAFVASPVVLHERRAPFAALEREALAQLALLRAHGIAPDHINEHMCFGWVPSLAGGVAQLNRRLGFPDFDRLNPGLPRAPGATPLARILGGLALAAPGRYRSTQHPTLACAAVHRFRYLGRPEVDVERNLLDQLELLCDPRLRNLPGVRLANGLPTAADQPLL